MRGVNHDGFVIEDAFNFEKRKACDNVVLGHVDSFC